MINADKVVLTGRKWEQKQYAWYTGYPASTRDGRQAAAAPAGIDSPRGRPPHVAQEQAGLQDPRKLKIYAGSEHPHQAQQPELKELGIKGTNLSVLSNSAHRERTASWQ